MTKKIIVTGGAGYIGSHTITDLLSNGYEVISLDNLSRGDKAAYTGIEKITGAPVKHYEVDLTDKARLFEILKDCSEITGIIHFAAFKSVPESVSQPLSYFHNNIQSLLNVLDATVAFNIPHFVFSSSCSVYGNTEVLPVTEDTPLGEAESPYARTKQMGEQICRDFSIAYPEKNIILLRYFNPAGTHPSALIGDFNKTPENVVPIITQTAAGIRPSMQIFGSDYPTKDGSCIRDYIHIMDIAHAHTLALEFCINNPGVRLDIFNLGTGDGVSVLELIKAFEETNGIQLNYTIGPRRQGDVISIYANNEKAHSILGWTPKYSLSDMMRSAWLWQQQSVPAND